MLSGGHLLSVLIFFPVVGAAALMMLRGDDHKFIRSIAMLVSIAEFLFSLLLLRGVPIGSSGYQLEEFAKWIPAPPIHYHLGVDGISMFLVLLTTFLTPISVLASWQSIQHRVKEFFVMLLLIEVGVVGVFLSLDLFLFFLFWELILIPMAFLIGIWGHERRVYAAVKFVLYTMAGSILMLVGIVWLYNATGTFDLPTIQQMLANGQLVLGPRSEMLLFLAFFVAFAIKVPLFPLHTWLPDAHVEAPTAGSVMLAGVLLKLGTYGMIRFCLPLFPEASHRAARWVAVLAIIGIIYGALVSMVQPNLKKLVAYSSVSHLGFVVLGIFAFHHISMQGAVFQMLAHGVSTGARRILPVCGPFVARFAHAQRLRGRVSDSARDLSTSLGLGRLGRSRGDPFRLLPAVVVSTRVLWGHYAREKPLAGGCVGPRELGSRNHGGGHPVDGRRLAVHNAAHRSGHANGDGPGRATVVL